MMDRPFANTPPAVMLREIYASGMSWRTIAKRLGYHYTTVYNCGSGRDRAGPALQRDVAQFYAQREAA